MASNGAVLLAACAAALSLTLPRSATNSPWQRAVDAAAPIAHRDRDGIERTAADCGSCHGDVHDEWQDSAHARAFTDPLFQQAMTSRAEPERCVPCHAPDSVLEYLGRVPRARADHREDGITCIACHRRGDVVHGPHAVTTDAHATASFAAFSRRGSFALCRGCHDLRIADVLPLAREFAAMGGVDGDESCVGCHMQSLVRRPGDGGSATAERTGRSHRLLGPADAEFCRSAFLLRIERAGTGHRLVLHNGAGHGVPGLARLRTFALRARLLDAAGKSLGEVALVLSSDDRLLADEDRRLALPAVRGAVALAVQVDHWFAGKKLATVLEQTLELP